MKCHKVNEGRVSFFKTYHARGETIQIEIGTGGISLDGEQTTRSKSESVCIERKLTHKSARWLWRGVTRDIKEESRGYTLRR